MKLTEIKEFILDKINKQSSVNFYTNQQWFHRIENNINQIILNQEEIVKNQNLIFLASYLLIDSYVDNTHTFYELESSVLEKKATLLQTQFTIDEISMKAALNIATEAISDEQTNKASQIINDAFLMDISCPINGENRISKMYDQLVSKGFTDTKTKWVDDTLQYLSHKNLQTPFANEHFGKHKKKIEKKLSKERKEINHQNDLVLEKELDISESELKELKKQLSKIKGRDDRGIQTLFRTTSKNHYFLKGLVDRKAQIMITVNSIILSLIIGRVIGTENSTSIASQLPFIIFSIVNVLSILFAILAITPIKTQGKFTEEEIRSKQGNLLYFGNFHNMKYPDFEWGFLQLLNDKDYLYLSMIRDFYYQGIELQKKFTFIRISLFIFLFGIILTSIIYLTATVNECKI